MSLTVQNLLDAQCSQPLAEILSQSFTNQDKKINDLSNKIINQDAEIKILNGENQLLSDKLKITDKYLIEAKQKINEQDIKINEQGVKLDKVVTQLTEVRHDLVNLDKKIVTESKKVTDHLESVIEKKQDDMKTFISNLFEGLKQK